MKNNNLSAKPSRIALDTGNTSLFTYDAANRLTHSQMHGAFETREELSEGELAQIDRDLDGTKEEDSYFEILPQNIILDTAARSFVYDFRHDVSVNRIELFPDSYTNRVRERDIRIYYRESENPDWEEIRNWNFTKDEKNGSLHFAFNEAVNARQIKIRCTWDDRNFLNMSIDTKATFKGNPKNLLRIWIFEKNKMEAYDYDSNSNRTSLTENGVINNYTYYKNKECGNTARVKTDGKWWHTYDENGNRTARGYNEKSDSDEVSIDKNREYWEYTWDLWNRLVEVEQHNAPDNASNIHVEYIYDVFNHRLERISKINGEEEKSQYAYGRNGAITYQKKTVGNSVTTRSFIYLNNQIAGFIDKAEDGIETIRYTVTDIQGSVTEVYDENNKLLWKSCYTAFGIRAGETTNLIDFDGLYTGCDYDIETGLTYHWNRWRSEDGSNWLSEDPARDGLNWYGYAGMNPINYTDNNGLAPYVNGVYEGPYNPDYKAPDVESGPQQKPYSITLNPDYTASDRNISFEDETKILTYLPDPDSKPKNPYYQNSENLQVLNNLSMIWKDGKLVVDENSCFRLNACNFMSYLFIVQDYTGYNFSLSEIVSIITYGQETINPTKTFEMSLLSDYTVKNPDVIMNKAFEIAGHPELTATAGYNIGDLPSRTYTNITVKTGLGNGHRVVGDFEGNVIYNPWNGGTITEINTIMQVYIHGVMKK